MKNIIYVLIIAACLFLSNVSSIFADYIDRNDGTLIDLSTGLMWDKKSYTVSTWDWALDQCQRVTTGGYDDWRLPTVKELLSLVLVSRWGPATTPLLFPDPLWNPNENNLLYYWSSTTYAPEPSKAWVVGLEHGLVNSVSKSDSTPFFRAVRAGKPELNWLSPGFFGGLVQLEVSGSKTLSLLINSSNNRGITPHWEWLVYLYIINGTQSPLYLVSDRGIYQLTDSVLAELNNYTFTFNRNQTTYLCRISMSDLGLKTGDYFIYGYAYGTSDGAIYLDNVVSINLK